MTQTNSWNPSPKTLRQAEQIITYRRHIRDDVFRPAAGMLSHPYLSAGLGATYPDLTDWDAVWSGAAYLIDGDPEPLRESLINFLDHIQPDGKGQRRIGRNGYSATPYQIRPFLAAGAFVLSRETDDLTWLGEEGLDRLESYLLYRHSHCTGREGLLTWYHIDEGFGDNGVGNWAWEPNAVEAVDLNAQMVYEHSAFAYMADKAGDERRARRHRQYAERLAAGINRLLWNEDDEFYYSLYIPPLRYAPSTQIKAVYSANLWPLWLGIVPEDRARRVIERYVLDAEHFWSPFGVRSLAKSERHYNNARRGLNMPTGYRAFQGPAIETATCSNVQGPIWSFVNYFAVESLQRYGYLQQAGELTAKIIDVHAESLDRHGAFHENYDAETGEPLAALGIASWCVMLPQLVIDLAQHSDWWLTGLDLPRTANPTTAFESSRQQMVH